MFRRSLAMGLAMALIFVSPALAGTIIYNNLTPNNLMAMASNPGPGEIEAADDFILSSPTLITSATFTGLLTGGVTLSAVGAVNIEIYRVFPLDSTNPPSGNVPTRVNSPSDNAFATAASSASQLTFNTTLLSSSFTATNSVGPGGIHVNTGGSGSVSGDEVKFVVTLGTPILLPVGHYFFVPQVGVTGGQFYWLSGDRPALNPFAPDLQTWIRDSALDPDWLRVGTDIVGGTTPPTFNGAFELEGITVAEPSTLLLLGGGLLGLGSVFRRKLG